MEIALNDFLILIWDPCITWSDKNRLNQQLTLRQNFTLKAQKEYKCQRHVEEDIDDLHTDNSKQRE